MGVVIGLLCHFGVAFVFGSDDLGGSAFERELRFIIDKKPRYVWGGAVDEGSGLDCSGFLYLAARRAALPVHRVCSAQIYVGGGGWVGRSVVQLEIEERDLVWFTFKAGRPYGHVGVLLRAGDGLPGVAHASVRRGVVMDPMAAGIMRSFVGAKRLAIGVSHVR